MSRTAPHMSAWKYAFALPLVALLLAVGMTASGPASASPAEVAGIQESKPPPSDSPADPSACGFDWSLMQSTFFGQEYNQLYSVDAASPNDVWAVGFYWEAEGQGNQALIEHWNGTQWTFVPAPHCCVGAEQQIYLYGVSVISSGDVWAVGSRQEGSLLQTVTIHWNGASWSVVDSANANSGQNNVLQSVAAISSNDVWAVGFYNDGTNRLPLLEHWNGSAWTVSPAPDTGFPQNDLFGVAATGANDVWAVGYHTGDLVSPSPDQTLTLHWNGSAWSVLPSANLSTDDANRLHGVAVAGPNNVWAVGYGMVGSVEKTLIERWNGSTWSVVPSANVPYWGNSLRGIAVAGPNDIWAVGFRYFSGGHYLTLIEHWNGTGWSVVTSATPNIHPTEKSLQGIVVTDTNPHDIWAVGFSSYTAELPDTTIIERYHPCATTCTLGFADAPPESAFYSYIRCLSCRSIFSGYADGTFRPNNNITRGQIAKVVSIAAGYTDDVTGKQSFTDVPSNHPFWQWIERLTMHQVMSGYADGTFRPYNNITRAQLSKVVVNVQDWAIDTTGGPHFGDVPDTHPFYTYIETAFNHGIISGYADGSFRPYNDVTRGQAAKIVSGSFNPFCYTP